jgi:hypothetical protein
MNTIPVISWRSVLLVEENGVPGENQRPVASHWKSLSHNVVSSTPLLSRIQPHNINQTTIRSWQLRFPNNYNILPEVHMLPSNFIYSFTVWFIDSNIGCHSSSLGLCIPVITDNVMVGTQLGKDKTSRNSSPENINYDKIYVMSFIWS